MIFYLIYFSLSLKSELLNTLISLSKNDVFHENLNDLLNDGINITTFEELFKDIQYLDLKYDGMINYFTNQSELYYDLPIVMQFAIQIQSYLNLSRTIYDISPEVKEWFLEHKNQFINIKPLLLELAPHLCTAFNVDLEIFYKLYNYIFINNENDGVKFGNIVKILELPKEFIPRLSKFLTFFSSAKTYSDLFTELNLLPQYNNFIQKVNLLKMPQYDSSEKFFSVIRIIDCIHSAFDLYTKIYTDFTSKQLSETIKPIVTKYLLKPFDISEVPISERASELNAALEVIQKYSFTCSDKQEVKCLTYKAVNSFFKKILCNPIGLSCPEDEAFIHVKSIVSLIVTLSDFPSNSKFYEAFFEELFEVLKLPGNHKYNLFFYEKVPFKTILKNFSKLSNFVAEINDSYNFKLIFDFLNMDRFWLFLRETVNKISQDKSLCEIFSINEEKCQNLLDLISDSAYFLGTKKSFARSLPEQFKEPIFDFYIPLLKSLSLNFSQFLTKFYNLKYKNNYNVDFSKFINSMVSLFERILTVIDQIFSEEFKRDPDFYKSYKSCLDNLNSILNMIKNNERADQIYYSIYGKLGRVIIEMLENGANSYIDENTTIETIVKSIRPTYFLNVYYTAFELSELRNLNVKELVNAISFNKENDPSKPSFDDFLPIQTFVRNSEQLAKEMNQEFLSIGTISKSLGIDKEKLKKFLANIVDPILSFEIGFMLGCELFQ